MSRVSARAPGTATTAGVVTRLLAAAVDLTVVLVALGLLILVAAGARFLWSPASFRWPAPPSELSLLLGALCAVGYLAVAWSETGRTYGGALLGIRVLGRDGGPLDPVRAALRAVLCLAFPLGLLWAAVSPSRRSLQDLVVGSSVHYEPGG
jgi:uncharacterized RDD family membrane protein YckC